MVRTEGKRKEKESANRHREKQGATNSDKNREEQRDEEKVNGKRTQRGTRWAA